MKLFLISQNANVTYDTYDSVVVAATDELTARNTNPATGEQMQEDDWKDFHEWCSSIDHIKAQYLGEATEGIKQGRILASFNSA